MSFELTLQVADLLKIHRSDVRNPGPSDPLADVFLDHLTDHNCLITPEGALLLAQLGQKHPRILARYMQSYADCVTPPAL